jgi:integrase
MHRRTKCTRTTDKAAAERIARKYEADTALRRDGVIDPELEAITKEARRTIESHLIDYESKLRAGGRSDQHISETLQYIRKICAAAGFELALDITAEGVNQYANQLAAANKSSRTQEAYLTAIKGFSRWLNVNHKLQRDLLTSVQKPNPEADRRRERRMLLFEEWRELERSLESGADRYGMPASDRLLLYRTAIQSGLRSNELRSLTRGRMYLESNPPYITCKARSTKNQKDARQHIDSELAAELKQHVGSRKSNKSVFTLPPETKLASMLRDDLADARKAWIEEAKQALDEYSRRQESDFLTAKNHDGEVIDFHSLRHTCGAWLAMTGAYPKVVQQVMRHSTITLTMDAYGHLFPGQEAEAVQRLKSVMGRCCKAEAAAGDDPSPRKSRSRRAQQLGYET